MENVLEKGGKVWEKCGKDLGKVWEKCGHFLEKCAKGLKKVLNSFEYGRVQNSTCHFIPSCQQVSRGPEEYRKGQGHLMYDLGDIIGHFMYDL